MTDGAPPGVSGPVGTPTAKRAAPAFTSMLRAIVVDAPASLRRSARYRELILRPRK